MREPKALTVDLENPCLHRLLDALGRRCVGPHQGQGRLRQGGDG